MGHRDIVRAAQRRYLWQVVVWLLVAGLGGGVLLSIAGAALGESMPSAMGVLGIVVMLGTVGGAFVIHRRNVRCPACGAWLVPVGANGFAPRACQNCKADLSS